MPCPVGWKKLPHMQLRNPHVRERLQWRLQMLSDPAYQGRVWHRHRLMSGEDPLDTFDEAINSLDDCLELDRDPHMAIGDVLLTPLEADAAVRLVKALDQVLDDVGPFGSFERAREHPMWNEVVAAAGALLRTMTT